MTLVKNLLHEGDAFKDAATADREKMLFVRDGHSTRSLSQIQNRALGSLLPLILYQRVYFLVLIQKRKDLVVKISQNLINI